MAASVMCCLTTSTVSALRPCSHQIGSSSFPLMALVKPTPVGRYSPTASQAVQSCSGPVAQDIDNPATVFSDDSKGIVCYRSESGEVTCEGWDEGPCFYPRSAQLSQQILKLSSACVPDIQIPRPFSFCTEDVKDICLREFMGAMFCEGRDES